MTPNWFTVSSNALADWERAQAEVWHDMAARRGEDPQIVLRDGYRRLAVYREDYRRRILSWFFKLCVPLKLGECVPNEVATLLGEEWDLATR